MASRLWRFLTTDILELWSGEAVSSTAEAAGAVFELAAVLETDGPKVAQLAPLVGQLDTLLDALNSPLAEIVEKSVPFLPIATGLLKFYLEQSQRPLTLANCVALVSQAAYLESCQRFLQDEALLARIGQVPADDAIRLKAKQLGNLEITDDEARRTVTNFPESQLALRFREVLEGRLVQAGLAAEAALRFAERVAWNTPRYMNEAWAASADAVKHLGQPTFADWRQEQAKYQSIADYLEKEITPGPREAVFNEAALTFGDIYVPLEAQLLNQKGEPIEEKPPQDLETWVTQHLLTPSDVPQILFIQGEAGRGKSVFCRMFADWVRRELYPAYVPILIRLRSLTVLENSLTDTLGNALETLDFVRSDPGWLTDNHTRFLFLLDGFDELLLEGRESGGLKEFLPQVVQFQKSSHHRFLITGRPLSLQGIERVIAQARDVQRAELQPMGDALRDRWYRQWAAKFGEAETEALQRFLAVCPEDIQNGLAREPLLLYLLGRMHREQRLWAAMFEGTEGTEAKVVIYDEAVRWVIEEQRQDENVRQVGLEPEDLRRALTEAAVCVMQSGNEVAKVTFLEARLQQDSNNPVCELLQMARQEVSVADDKLLNNLLTSFYIKPASGDREGSVEFAHKSFGEFLFAERLKDALEDWSRKGERRRGKYLVPPEVMHWEVYDLLGYGGLTREVVDYLRVLLTHHSDFDPVVLFERLHDFYRRWWNGEFMDSAPDNLPQKKMLALRERMPDRETHLGLRQVDVVTGLNVMILLLELHRYGQQRDDLKAALTFHPCGDPDQDDFDQVRLYRIMGYGECLEVNGFVRVVGANLSRAYLSRAYLRSADLSRAYLRSAYLRSADLSSADLSSADLSRADLSRADLRSAYLFSAYLFSANLSSAYLRSADLSRADLSRADLSRANLSSADLSRADLFSAYLFSANLSRANLSSAYLSSANLANVQWDAATQWANARGLHEAINIPAALAETPRFAAAVVLSQGLQQVAEGDIPGAIQAYQTAQDRDATIPIAAYSWHTLCWQGCLRGYASEVLFAGDEAVKLAPDFAWWNHTRGLARAMTGDAEGAIDDFQTLVDGDGLPESMKTQARGWLEVLQQGQNPFTPEVLATLREDE